MKNSKYWAERFEVLESAMNRYGQDAYKQIEPAFDRALREIDQSVEKWLNRIAVNNQISLADARKLLDAGQLEEFKWTVEEYIKYGQENAINQQWMKQLENASAKFHISKLEAMRVETQNALEKAFGNYTDEVDNMAKKVIENGYYRSIYEVQRGIGVGWDVASLNESKLKRLISKPWATDGENFSSRIWKNKTEMVSKLHNELTRNCILGKAPDEAIRDMTQYVNKFIKNAKSAAGRLVMTEEAYFSAEAQRESFKELGVEEYEIIATLDSKTSEICQDMDGRIFPMSQYEPGATAPPFHPWCRTTTAPYFNDLGEYERAARDKNGKTYYVPGDMKYSEWKKSFVDGEKTPLKSAPDNDIIEIKQGKELSLSNLDEFEQWQNEYYEANSDIEFSRDNFPNIYEYTGGSYEAINAVERFAKGSSEYERYDKAFHGIEKYRKISENISKELSKFRNIGDLQVRRHVGTVDYITGTTSSIEDMRKAIGKVYTEKGFTSTTICSDATLPFGGGKETQTVLEIFVPKETRGAYIYKISDSPAEFEYLIDKNTKFKVVDAGVREVEHKRWDGKTIKKQERYMRLEVIIDE